MVLIKNPIFEEGISAGSDLEAMAEDGNNEGLNTTISAETGYVSPFAPVAYSLAENTSLFTEGTVASEALENIAEDGDPSGFDYIVNIPAGKSSAGPIFPGDSYTFTMKGEEMENLSMVFMLVQSNDWFIGIEKL